MDRAFNKLIGSIRMMTQHSQSDWAAIESDEARIKDVLARARGMMKLASDQYRSAIRRSTGKELFDFTHNWSPKRVLSRNPQFRYLCVELEDTKVWNRLKRHERKFLTEAYEMSRQ